MASASMSGSSKKTADVIVVCFCFLPAGGGQKEDDKLLLGNMASGWGNENEGAAGVAGAAGAGGGCSISAAICTSAIAPAASAKPLSW